MDEYRGRDMRYVALAMDVLAVAVQGGRGDDWAAYIGSVPGNRHSEEWVGVLRHGEKLHQVIAEVMFPDFAQKYEYRR